MDYAVQPSPARKTHHFFIALTIAIPLFAGIGWYFAFVFGPTSQPVALAWKMLNLPEELKSATFFSEDTQYDAGHLGLRHSKSSYGSILSAASFGEDTALIAKSDSGSYHVLLDGSELFSTTTQVSQLSVAPDGSHLAFTVPAFSKQTPQVDAPLGSLVLIPASEKMVVVYKLATKEFVSIGVGAAPLFLDAAHIVRISAAGLVREDINSGLETLLLAKPSTVLQGELLLSKDRSLMALTDKIENKVRIYRILNNSFALIHELEMDFIPSALGDDELYEISIDDTGSSTLWAHPFNGSETREIIMFPAYLGITALSL